MNPFLEKLIVRLWNRRVKDSALPVSGALDLGGQVVDGEATGVRVGIEQSRRAESVVLIGKTGTGKSSLIRYLAQQDLYRLRGFAFFDLHGDVTSFLLKTIALRERALNQDLSDRLIVIDPSDPDFSVAMNPLEDESQNDRFVQIAEFAQILKERWHLDSLGARTDELLRNVLYALAENGLTLVEIVPFLSDSEFRSRCLAKLGNADVREYFELRYDQASDAMKRVLAEPVLNKVSLFISDARFRHLLGQRRSTFSLVDAMDRGYWVILKA